MPVASKILEAYREISSSGLRPLTQEIQSIIAEADKPKKGGQKATPPVSVNAFDAGAGASGFTSTHISPPISPLRQNDPDMIYGDDEDDFEGFTYSLFTIRTESDDEALVMRGKLMAIHEKLDSLIQASNPSSTDEYSQATVKSLLETLTKEHSTNLEKMNKGVDDTATVCNNTTEKVDKVIFDATAFMNNFQTSFESNTAKANEAISNLGSSLKAEREKFQEVRTGIKNDHDEFKSSISSQISKLRDDLAMESKIMDSLTIKNEKVKVLFVKLEQAEKQVKDLLSKRAVMKICSTDVTGLLSDIIETRGSMITITIRKHLVEKLRLVFVMLHHLEGVPKSSSILKQGKINQRRL
ncbi:unnamed protein product [Lactuca saligna]|uniref:Uncharacterized protein n=1 Tax=Lactuca saligna TaxID=75948 RepID=A0AA36EAD1_LACSI|nr:unnamed protein product [Lactuca saligna]